VSLVQRNTALSAFLQIKHARGGAGEVSAGPLRKRESRQPERPIRKSEASTAGAKNRRWVGLKANSDGSVGSANRHLCRFALGMFECLGKLVEFPVGQSQGAAGLAPAVYRTFDSTEDLLRTAGPDPEVSGD